MLKSLCLNNFRNHANTYIPLEKVNIFVGPNGAGKSSIQGGIEFLFTGKCNWTDRKGSGAEDLIRYGQKKAVLEAEVEGIGNIKRDYPGGLKVEGWSGNSTLQQKTFYEQLKATEGIISAVLNTGNFLNMPAGDQKNMLFALMGLEFDKNSILKSLAEWTEKNGLSKETAKAILLTFQKYCPQAVAGGAEIFDTLDKAFREARKIAKKELAELDSLVKYKKEACEKIDLPDGITLADKEEVIEQLNAVKKEKESLASTIVHESFMAERREMLDKRETRVKDELSKLEQEIKNTVIIDTGQMEAELKKVNDKYDKANAEAEEASKQQAILNAEIASLDKVIASLEKIKGACPLAPEKLTCPHPEKDLKEMLKQFIKEKTDKAKAKDAVDKTLDAFRETCRELKKQQDQLVQNINRGEEVEAKLQSLKKQKEGYEASLTEIEQERISLGEPQDVEETRNKIAELETRIEKGENLRQALELSDQAETEYEENVKKFYRKDEEVNALEELVKAFSPGGIKQELLKEIVNPVQERISERVAQLTGGLFRVVFEVEGDFEIKVFKNDVLYKKPSKGEKLLIGVALQDVLSSLAGFGIIVVDDTEALDPDNRVNLINTLLSLEDDKTVIVLSVRGEKEPVDPGIPGLAVFMVDNGKVYRAQKVKQPVGA